LWTPSQDICELDPAGLLRGLPVWSVDQHVRHKHEAAEPDRLACSALDSPHAVDTRCSCVLGAQDGIIMIINIIVIM